jgi:histidinol phosphatase-like PHP family hydrolase
MSNIERVIPAIIKACEENNRFRMIRAIPGVEITHVPPSLIGRYVAVARQLGAKLVVVHGETVVEPVEPGTNRAAIEAGVDILAHPGLITEEEAKLAALGRTHLEITARKGHSLTNGHVAALALKTGAKLVLDTDAHEPGDLIDEPFAKIVATGAGLTEERYAALRFNMELLAGLTGER